MPQLFTAGAGVTDDPGLISGILNDTGNTLGVSFTPGQGPNTWQVPQGTESGSGSVSITISDSNTGLMAYASFRFELFYGNATYPAPQRNNPTDPWAKS
jgi:hypothetical protein